MESAGVVLSLSCVNLTTTLVCRCLGAFRRATGGRGCVFSSWRYRCEAPRTAPERWESWLFAPRPSLPLLTEGGESLSF